MFNPKKIVDQASQVVRPDTRAPEVAPVKDAATQVLVDHIHAVHSNTRAQLDILRKTRGQREVGEVKIPAHLQVVEALDASGVEVRSQALPIRGVRD